MLTEPEEDSSSSVAGDTGGGGGVGQSDAMNSITNTNTSTNNNNNNGIIELAGLLKRRAIKGSVGKTASDENEIIAICYREKVHSNVNNITTTTNTTQDKIEIEGYFDWSERGVRSVLTKGYISKTTNSITFTIPCKSSLLGTLCRFLICYLLYIDITA